MQKLKVKVEFYLDIEVEDEDNLFQIEKACEDAVKDQLSSFKPTMWKNIIYTEKEDGTQIFY